MNIVAKTDMRLEPPIVWRIDVHMDERGYYALLNPVGHPTLARIGPPFSTEAPPVPHIVQDAVRHATPCQAISYLAGSLGTLLRCFQSIFDAVPDTETDKKHIATALQTLKQFFGPHAECILNPPSDSPKENLD